MKTIITKLPENLYSAVTDVVMPDGTLRADHRMALTGKSLRSLESKGYVRVDGILHFSLGPISMAAISALAVGESVTLTN